MVDSNSRPSCCEATVLITAPALVPKKFTLPPIFANGVIKHKLTINEQFQVKISFKFIFPRNKPLKS